jgi:hypothetical protein
VGLPDHIVELMEDYRLAREVHERAQRDLAAAQAAFVQRLGSARKDGRTRVAALAKTATVAARNTEAEAAVARKAAALAEALAQWQLQRRKRASGEIAADLVLWQR